MMTEVSVLIRTGKLVMLMVGVRVSIIAEIISFENQLSESEALQIEHYLATKWKLDHANPTIGYPFTLDGNGSLKNKASFDYETDDKGNYSITVRATDDHSILRQKFPQ